MFEDSLLESAGRIQSHRGRATAASFAVQSVLLATLALLPLLYTDTLPGRMWAPNALFVPPPPPPPGAQSQAHVARRAISEIAGGQILFPRRIPQLIPPIVDEQAPSAATIDGVPNGVNEGIPNGVLHGIPPEGAARPLPPKPPSPPRLRVSQGVVEGLLIHQVKPAYPHIAMQTHAQGEVVLHAIIGRDGSVSSLELVRGHPLLVPAAIDAVREWKYRPYTLNGEPVEVETLITVRFVLGN